MSQVKYKIDGTAVISWQRFNDGYEHFELKADEIICKDESLLNYDLDDLEYDGTIVKLKSQSWFDDKKAKKDKENMIKNKEREIINRMAIQELKDEGKL